MTLEVEPAWLFCPGHRVELFEKARQATSVLILDLEDAVPASNKSRARRLVADAINATHSPTTIIVRCNDIRTQTGRDDLDTLRQTSLQYLMIPKTPPNLSTYIDDRFSLIALCETPKTILSLSELSEDERIVGLAWGALDLAASIGAKPIRSESNAFNDVGRLARSRIVLAAAGSGKMAIDTVFPRVNDTAGISREAHEAAALGFDAKLAIHPSQIETIRRAFQPTVPELAWARRIVAAFAESRGRAAILVDGELVDPPVMRRAQMLLRRVPGQTHV